MNGGWEHVGEKKKKQTVNKPTTVPSEQITSGKQEGKTKVEIGIPTSKSTFQIWTEKKGAKKQVVTEHQQQTTTSKVKEPKQPSKNIKLISSEGETGNKKKGANKENRTEKEEDKPKGLENALRSLTKEKIDSVIENTTSHFPTTPLVWLQDIASYINSRVSRDPPDPLFSGKPHDYPFCLMKKDVQETIFNLLARCNPAPFKPFLDYCIHSIITNLNTGRVPCAGGYKVMLQALAIKHPEIWPLDDKWFRNIESVHGRNDAIISSILWVTLQPGYYNIEVGLKLWTKIFMPYVKHGYFSKYVISCLGDLIDFHTNTAHLKGRIDARDFFPLMDHVFTLENSSIISRPQARLLIGNCLKLRDLIYSKQENTVKTFFPSFLTRLRPDTPTNIKNEVLINLVRCLNSQPHCFSAWEKLYRKNLIPTFLFLEYLTKNGDKKSAQLTHLQEFNDSLKFFSSINQEILSSSVSTKDKDKATAVKCEVLIKELTTVNRRSKPPSTKGRSLYWSVFILSSLIGLVLIDLQLHGSFAASRTHQFMELTSTLEFSKMAWNKVSKYALPIYQQAKEKTSPYLTLAWKHFSEVTSSLWSKAGPVREYFDRTILPNLDQLTEKVWPHLLNGAQQSLIYSSDFAIKVKNYSIIYGSQAVLWLKANVFIGSLSPDNLASLWSNLTSSFEHYSNQAYETAIDQWNHWSKSR